MSLLAKLTRIQVSQTGSKQRQTLGEAERFLAATSPASWHSRRQWATSRDGRTAPLQARGPPRRRGTAFPGRKVGDVAASAGREARPPHGDRSDEDGNEGQVPGPAPRPGQR